jgi:hypothetical protein
MDPQRELLKNLGFPDADVEQLQDGEPSVPVNVEKIRQFYRGELLGAEQLDVAFLLSHERAWYDRSTEVLLEIAKERPSSPGADE